VDRSNDKAKLAAKNGNESGRPIWLAVSVLGDQCHVDAFLPATRRVSWLLFKARATTNLDHQANGTGLIKARQDHRLSEPPKQHGEQHLGD